MAEHPTEKHLWQYTAVRDVALLAIAALVVAGAYSIRQVLAPILIGAALAYVFNPLVSWAEKRRLPRWASAAILVAVALAVIVVFLIVAGRLVLSQALDLLQKLPSYAQIVAQRLGVELDWTQLAEQARSAAKSQLDAGSAGPVAAALAATYNLATTLVASLVHFVSYALIAVVVVALCFFFFVWHWGPILRWFEQFIPPVDRDQTLRVLKRMDQSVSAFIRGRLVQALVMGAVLSLGWQLADVPYWLLLGLGSGALNLVPFAGLLGFLVAVSISVVDHTSTTAAWSWGVLLWPALVYGVAQLLDGWVVEPIVQGKATNLDPLTVLLAVLIGGALAGLLGLIVAIPAAACLKILAQEWLVPRLRELSHTISVKT